ncbi:MAG: hypothetical protein Q9221_007981 [Calogaya cf. arnoldii]
MVIVLSEDDEEEDTFVRGRQSIPVVPKSQSGNKMASDGDISKLPCVTVKERVKPSLSGGGANPNAKKIAHRKHLTHAIYTGQETKKFEPPKDAGPANYGQSHFDYPIWNQFDPADDGAEIRVPDTLYGVRLTDFHVYNLVLQNNYDLKFLADHFNADFSRDGPKESRVACGRGAIVNTEHGEAVGTLGNHILHGDNGERKNLPDRLVGRKKEGLGAYLAENYIPSFKNAVPTTDDLLGITWGHEASTPKIRTVQTTLCGYRDLLKVVVTDGSQAETDGRRIKRGAQGSTEEPKPKRVRGKGGRGKDKAKADPTEAEQKFPEAYRAITVTPEPEDTRKGFKELFRDLLVVQKKQAAKMEEIGEDIYTEAKKPDVTWQTVYETMIEASKATQKALKYFEHTETSRVRVENRQELNTVVLLAQGARKPNGQTE